MEEAGDDAPLTATQEGLPSHFSSPPICILARHRAPSHREASRALS
jgi:hypothetical protein